MRINGDVRIKLLFDLSYQRRLRTFSLFDLSTRKFPTTFELSVASFGSKDLAIAHDNGGNDIHDFLHGFPLYF